MKRIDKLPILIFLSLLFFLIVVFVSTNITKKPSLSKNNKKVATTIFPLYDITKNIAGNGVEVVLLLKPGASPHTFDPSPREVKNLSGSAAIFVVGHGLDDWTSKLADSVGIEKIITIDKNINLLKTLEKHGSVDPHYWLSVKNAILIAEQIKDELSILFPNQASTFEKNFNTHKNQLEQLDSEVNQKLDNLTDKNIATFHSAWNYFAQDHGVNIVATFEEYPGKQPSPKYLLEFQEKIKESKVKVIFAEPQFSTAQLEPIANDLGVKISILDPLGGVEGRYSYIELIRYNVNQLVNILQ